MSSLLIAHLGLILAFSQPKQQTIDTLQASSDYIEARSLYRQQKNSEANALFLKAAESFKENQIWDRYLTSLNRSAYCLWYLKNKEEAFTQAQEVISKSVQYLGKDKLPESIANHLLADIYNFGGELDKALNHYNKALAIRLSNSGKNNIRASDLYNDLGQIYFYKGMFDEALYNFKKGYVVTTEESDDLLIEAKYFNAVGEIYKNTGQHDLSLEHYKKSLTAMKKLFGEKHHFVAIILNNIGEIYNYIGEYDLALEQYYESIPIILEIAGENHLETASLYYNLAKTYGRKHAYDSALKYNERSYSINSILFGEDHFLVARNLMEKAIMYRSLGMTTKAINHFERSNNIFTSFHDGKHYELAQVRIGFADLYLDTGDYEKALSWYHQALIASSDDFDQSNVSSNPRLNDFLGFKFILSALNGKALAFKKKFEKTSDVKTLKLSASTFQLADSLIGKDKKVFSEIRRQNWV